MMLWVILASVAILWTISAAFAADKPVFDPTISLGVVLHLLSLIGTLVTGLFFAGRFVERQKQEFLQSIQKLHTDMTGKIGALTERISIVESRVSDLWESWKIGR